MVVAIFIRFYYGVFTKKRLVKATVNIFTIFTVYMLLLLVWPLV